MEVVDAEVEVLSPSAPPLRDAVATSVHWNVSSTVALSPPDDEEEASPPLVVVDVVMAKDFLLPLPLMKPKFLRSFFVTDRPMLPRPVTNGFVRGGWRRVDEAEEEDAARV